MCSLRMAWQQLELSAEEAARHLKAVRVQVDAQRHALQRERELLSEEQRQLADARAAARAQAEELQALRAKLAEERRVLLAPGDTSGNDLIGLNFGGASVVTVKRSLLYQFEDTMLARMFSGRYDEQLDRDKDGNVFFDYSPDIMGPLVDYLRLHRDASPEDPAAHPRLPSEHHSGWNSMIKFFGMEDVFQVTTFYGIRTDLKLSSLQGWTRVFCKPYSHRTTMADFSQAITQFGAQALLLGARRAGEDQLVVAAMGNVEAVVAERDEAATRHHNGVHWYCQKGKSVGFAPKPTVELDSADTVDLACKERLSWHLNGCGGWRAGSCIGLDTDEWEKVVFASRTRLDC